MSARILDCMLSRIKINFNYLPSSIRNMMKCKISTDGNAYLHVRKKADQLKYISADKIKYIAYILPQSKQETAKIIPPSTITAIEVASSVTSIAVVAWSEYWLHLSQRGKHVPLLRKKISLQFMWFAVEN